MYWPWLISPDNSLCDPMHTVFRIHTFKCYFIAPVTLSSSKVRGANPCHSPFHFTTILQYIKLRNEDWPEATQEASWPSKDLNPKSAHSKPNTLYIRSHKASTGSSWKPVCAATLALLDLILIWNVLLSTSVCKFHITGTADEVLSASPGKI